ncbi:MAG TPA: alpha/beta hydrolase-fold protein [Phnomibacter sp.]|nr:alpha/beta hydrolase-fold protein [Phnomibacter sp.]
MAWHLQSHIFDLMTMAKQAEAATETLKNYAIETFDFFSDYLDRVVTIETYLPINIANPGLLNLLLVNDGQDLPKMPFAPLIDQLVANQEIEPILVVGIYCNEHRKLEYGTADVLDYMGRGSRARYHRKFVLRELIPFIKRKYYLPLVKEISFAGFSLGGLSAMDIAWKHPEVFTKVGVFSGSLWWRLKDLNNGYVEETDRIMHKLVREGGYAPHQRFFFATGTLDETMDRNHNGIIDSIDDTLGLIAELEAKGYKQPEDIHYLELPDGRHDVPTWARAFPYFLKWGWGLPSL